MSSHANRTPKGHLNSVYARLGQAAVIGGPERVLRELTSDRFASTLMAARDADTRRKILETAQAIADKARQKPRAPKPPNPNERTKVRWTDEVIARYKRLAPRHKDPEKLALAMGFPAYCAGSMKAARPRFFPKAASATARKPQIDSRAAVLPLAA